MIYLLRMLAVVLMFTPVSAKANLACNVAANSEKVVVAGGSLTEIMYFLGLQKKIVALDVTTSYPKEAKKLP